MQKERFSRRKLIGLAGAGLVAAGLPQIASAQEVQPGNQENGSLLEGLGVLAAMYIGFRVMMRRRSSGDPEIDRLQQQSDDLRRKADQLQHRIDDLKRHRRR